MVLPAIVIALGGVFIFLIYGVPMKKAFPWMLIIILALMAIAMTKVSSKAHQEKLETKVECLGGESNPRANMNPYVSTQDKN